MQLLSFPRSNSVYQSFPDYFGSSVELTENAIQCVLTEILAELNKAKDAYAAFLAAKGVDAELISAAKSEIVDLEHTCAQVELISDIVFECSAGVCDFEKVLFYKD